MTDVSPNSHILSFKVSWTNCYACQVSHDKSKRLSWVSKIEIGIKKNIFFFLVFSH